MEHNQNLIKVLERVKDCGFRFKVEKCKFSMTDIKYLGHIIEKDGIRQDPSRIEAILQILPPHDLTTLRSFLEAVNYYGKFVKNIKNIRGPLDQCYLNCGPRTSAGPRADSSWSAILIKS